MQLASKKPAGAKGKTNAKADSLIKGAKKGGAELTEHDLDKVTGGFKVTPDKLFKTP